jgi:hypothetical protein
LQRWAQEFEFLRVLDAPGVTRLSHRVVRRREKKWS